PQSLMTVGGGMKLATFDPAHLANAVPQTTGLGAMPAGFPFDFTYSAPEKVAGIEFPGSAQFSLAVIYCQMRSGHLPFQGEGADALAGFFLRSPDLSNLPE